MNFENRGMILVGKPTPWSEPIKKPRPEQEKEEYEFISKEEFKV